MQDFLAPELLARVDGLRPLAAELGISLAQLALAWSLRRANVASVIVGATSVKQLQENARASGVRIPPELDAIVQRMGAKDPHVRLQSARDVVIALQAWLPVAEWQALGIASERPQDPAVARTAMALPALPAARSGKTPPPIPASHAKAGGFIGFLKRLFGR